jgi:hypothetical protein
VLNPRRHGMPLRTTTTMKEKRIHSVSRAAELLTFRLALGINNNSTIHGSTTASETDVAYCDTVKVVGVSK